ncbi:hypothetical protein PENTCL1PPCAC_4137 [Pristionchus entomophagus]|uniref:Methyltransferase domain-containing protein n=1 Tax=Pristionchus entomophagus TaxID=358040 RepID=A0AAV5SH32_9BILA|nr:hypothetical protein PENTCL1PPCAC_4137 [Pristionchus entomophagus]
MPDLKSRLNTMLMGGMVTPTIALGKKLGLFEALGEVASAEAPADVKTIADKADCKERYVREWLAVLSCAGFIEVTPDEKFWLTEEAKHEFTGLNNLAVAEMSFLPTVVKTFNELSDAFKKNGRYGLEYAQFGDFYDTMDSVTTAMHDAHLISDYFPLIDMSEKLAEGSLKVLDVGCGSGYHALKMASTYPKCEIHGADISEKAIGMAKDSLKEQGHKNLTFHVEDAGKMPSEWTNTFDFITIFDACHDQMRPDLCLNEIYRMLKPGGVFAMLEIRGCSNIHADKVKHGPFASAFYAVSMFHCLPVGSNRSDALCMGAMWGEQRAKKLIEDAGFKKEHVQVFEPAYFPINIVYLCKKE